MAIFDQISQLSLLLQTLDANNPNQEVGANEILPPKHDTNTALTRAGLLEVLELVEFYNVCDGFNLGEVYVGYYVNPVGVLLQIDLQNGPLLLSLDGETHHIRPFGSTGGGDLFVINVESGKVLFLPPDLLEGNCYYGKKSRVKVAASSISSFLDIIIQDVTAYLNDNIEHVYIPKRFA